MSNPLSGMEYNLLLIFLLTKHTKKRQYNGTFFFFLSGFLFSFLGDEVGVALVLLGCNFAVNLFSSIFL